MCLERTFLNLYQLSPEKTFDNEIRFKVKNSRPPKRDPNATP